MSMAMLASLVCLTILLPPKPLVVALVKHCPDEQDGIFSIMPMAQGFADIQVCPPCIQWEPWATSDRDGCVDMDLLPVPKTDSVYWVKEK